MSKALKGRETSLPTMMFDKEKDGLMENIHSDVMLYLGNEVLCEVVEEDRTAKLWLKLESLYMTVSYKSLLFKEEVVHFPDERR